MSTTTITTETTPPGVRTARFDTSPVPRWVLATLAVLLLAHWAAIVGIAVFG